MAAYLDLPVRPGITEGFDALCNCQTCPLLSRRADTWCPPQRPAWFNGLYILGEGPGSNEARLKQPFIGRSGALLDELLDMAGIRREQCFISNATSCIDGRTIVRLADGRAMRIDRLVKTRHAGAVLSWDATANCLVARRVTNWYRTPRGDRELISLSYETARRSTRGATRSIVTGDHLIATPRGWVRADALTSGDEVLTPTGMPQGRALDVVVGSLLGDGMVHRSNFRLSHAEDQVEWCREKQRVLTPFVARTWWKPPQDNAQAQYFFETQAAPFWRWLKPHFYGPEKRQRRVPRELVAAAGAQAIAVWFLDDGSITDPPDRAPRAEIACGWATREDATWLTAELNRRGLECRLTPAHALAQRIQFSVAGTYALSKLCAAYTPPCVQYKLLGEHRGLYKPATFDPSPVRPFVDRVVVTRNVKPTACQSVYCLEVEETHNFATAAVVAHNCMPPYMPPTKKQSERNERDELLRDSAQACHGRVRAEIEALQPRVILALGGVALEVLTGTWIKKTSREPLFADAAGNALPCWRCEGEMTLPFFKCSHCGEESIQYKRDAQFCGQAAQGFWSCEHCHASHASVTFGPRKRRCPVCQGRKTKEVTRDLWRSDHRISAVNGMVFRGRYAPDYDEMEASAKVDLPCHYLIATYHPSFLLRDPKEDAKAAGRGKPNKKQAGQFLLPSARAHFRKATRLLTEDARWRFKHRVLPDMVEAQLAQECWRRLAELPCNPPGACQAHGRCWSHSLDEAEERGLQAAALADSLTELEAYLRGPAYFWSTDIETDNKDPWAVTDIRCIGFHKCDANGHPLDTPAIVVNTSQLGLEHPLVRAICEFLLDEGRIKLFQNGIYDIQVLWHLWRIDCKGYRFDTLLAHNSLYTDAPHDLQHIAGIYTDAPPWKPVKKVKDELVYESSAQLHAYNGRDVLNTSLAWLPLADEMERARVPSGNARYVHDLDVAMSHCCRDMERAGLPISREQWERWQARCDFYVNRAQSIAQAYIGRADFDLSKPAHVAWALFDPSGPCRLQPMEYTDTGTPSTSKTALLTYRHHPLVALTLDFRRWRDVRSRTLEGMPLMSDWRIRVRWNAIGARTGRFTTSPNAQNWSKVIEMLIALYEGLDEHNRGLGGPWPLELYPGDEVFVAKAAERAKEKGGKVGAKIETPGVRELVVVPPGRKLVGADLSQAELRIVAALSGDKNLIEKCLSAREDTKLEPDYDPHSYVASIAFGAEYTRLDWRNSDEDKLARARLRDLIKRVIYGLFYGAAGPTILEAIYDGGYEGPPITLEQIETIIAAIFTAFPDVKSWRDRQLKEAERTGSVYDALIGRRRIFPAEDHGRHKVDPTIAYNFGIQSSCASMMNMSMWELRNRLPSVDPTALILAQVHDAIYVECAEDKAELVKALLEQTMSQELRLVDGAPYMPFPATGKIADSWFEAA